MKKERKDGFYCRFVKRVLDILIAVLFMLLFWWVCVIVAILVRVKLGSPVLYVSRRPGKDAKLFSIYKFRSMTNETDENGVLLPGKLRTPRFGTILRSTSLDELPELFINVLKGDMSLVGPRPLSEKNLPYYTEEEMHRHDVLPGITGLAQVNGRNNLNWDERFALDLQYVKEVSFILDMKIVFKTVAKVFTHADIADTAQGHELSFDEYRTAQRANEKTGDK